MTFTQVLSFTTCFIDVNIIYIQYSCSSRDICILLFVYDCDDLLFKLRTICWTIFDGDQKNLHCNRSGFSGSTCCDMYPLIAILQYYCSHLISLTML